MSYKHSLIHIEEELPGAKAWAARHDLPMDWLPDSLVVRVTLAQRETKEEFYLQGKFDNYRAIAPAWTFTDRLWTAEPAVNLFPRPAAMPGGKSSIFHTKPAICAPFNRLAYSVFKGPHSDWGGPENWLTAGQPNEVKAFFIGDMLSVIYQHFSVTAGRMG